MPPADSDDPRRRTEPKSDAAPTEPTPGQPPNGPTAPRAVTVVSSGPEATKVGQSDGEDGVEIFLGPDVGLPTVASYEVLGVLGRGAMGVVYKARHQTLKRTVALKMMLAGAHAGPDERARFRVEAEAVARLVHPNIVQIHEVGETGGLPYCALEFVEGGSLAQLLGSGPLPPRTAARLVETLARAVQLAHSRNVVHRDLKPGNILLASPGRESGEWVPKITDFGLARQLDTDSGATRAGAVVGTPSYMAPEQAAGASHDAGPGADVYALGAILYECLAGRRAFQGRTVMETLDQVRTQEPAPPSRWQARVPADLDAVVLKCLRKEPQHRYASAAELADDLGRYQRGEPVAARLVGNLERCWRWCRRNKTVAALVAAVAVTLVLGTTVAVFFAVQADHKARDEERARLEADAKKLEAQQQRETAERNLAVGTLLRVGLLYEHDPAAALALLEDPAAIRADLRGPAWGFYRNFCRRKLRSLPGHAVQVSSVVWSPDGQTLASAGDDGTIKLWAVASGKAQVTLNARQKEVLALAFSPDGRTLASAGLDHAVRLWDVATGTERAVLAAHTAAVPALTWSPDGKMLASAGEDRTVRLWDVAARRPRAALRHELAVLAVAFSPDGTALAAAGGDGAHQVRRGELRVWDVATRRPRCDLQGHTAPIHAVAWSPDGKVLASAGIATMGDQIKLWDPATGVALPGIPQAHNHTIYSIAISPDGATLASAGEDKTVKLWDVATRRERAAWHGHARGVMTVAFSPDGTTLASASRDGAVKLWDVGGAELASLPLHGGEIWTLALHPDGKTLASAGLDQSIKLWRPGADDSPTTLPANDPCWCVAFSPDGKVLASAAGRADDPGQWNAPGELKLWDVAGRRTLRTLTGHVHSVRSVAFSPDGRTLATGSVDQTIKLWDPTTGRERATLKGHRAPVWCVSFSPDGRTLASAGVDSMVRLWDVAGGRERATLTGHAAPVTSVTWSPDGTTLASASWDQTVQLWDVAGGARRASLNAHAAVVWGTAWSPDGRTLASASADQTIKLWDVAGGQERATIKSSTPMYALRWSADGRTLFSAGVDVVQLWDLSTDADAGPAAGAPRELARAARSDRAVWVARDHYVHQRWADAEAAYRQAGRLGPLRVGDQFSLMSALHHQGKQPEALEVMTELVRRVPNHSGYQDWLGFLWLVQNQPDRAIPPLRRALELNPRNAQACINLGAALLAKGQLDEALASYRRADAIDPRNEYARSQLALVERLAAGRDRFAAFQGGTYKPATTAERLGMIEWCYVGKRYRAGAGLYADAFAADPPLAEDRKAAHRSNAACFAALAAAGQGADAAGLGLADRARLRQQALTWLRADLAVHARQMAAGPPADRASRAALAHWRRDPDLAGIRAEAALAKLPPAERAAFARLWADVAALLKQAETPVPQGSK